MTYYIPKKNDVIFGKSTLDSVLAKKEEEKRNSILNDLKAKRLEMDIQVAVDYGLPRLVDLDQYILRKKAELSKIWPR